MRLFDLLYISGWGHTDILLEAPVKGTLIVESANHSGFQNAHLFLQEFFRFFNAKRGEQFIEAERSDLLKLAGQ